MLHYNIYNIILLRQGIAHAPLAIMMLLVQSALKFKLVKAIWFPLSLKCCKEHIEFRDFYFRFLYYRPNSHIRLVCGYLQIYAF